MDSFILRSKTHIPWGALRLLVAAGVALLASVAYLNYGNPQITFYKKTIQIKQTWAHKLTQQYGNKTLIFGGSSCAFSIDGERLLEKHQIPTVNMGLHAGLRPTMLTNWALSETSPGDTLIVAIEPSLLTDPLDSLPLAIQLSYAIHSPAWLDAPWLDHPVSRVSSLFALRPSGYNLLVRLGRIIKRLPSD